MTDVIPQEDNRFAVLIGRVFHPYWLPIPTTLALLNGIPWPEALGWTVIICGIVVLPGALYAAFLEKRGRYRYQRQTRHRLYLVGWFSVLSAFVVVLAFGGPHTLIASMGALVVWVPLQGLLNAWVTKVSGHAAVAAGCYTGLLLLGRLDTLTLQLGLLALVLLTLWARVVTKHHTVQQVVLGSLAGILPVVLVFPLVLR
ncbi:MAG: hypothetical protein IPK17_13435 [Chloroflexi bacterium]|uniref:hypothetical protein n=1 Tax=Candidatus Flexifilum breve TaxID=3140694 RepID=UPI0031368E8B|nr:hypothetical protein [Chloroflexota bacterium]